MDKERTNILFEGGSLTFAAVMNPTSIPFSAPVKPKEPVVVSKSN